MDRRGYDELERVCRSIAEKGFWTEGWIAVRQTIYYNSNGFSPEVSAKLEALEELLQPKDLVQRVRSVVLSETVTFIGVDATDNGTDIQKILARVDVMAYELGKAVAVDQDSFTTSRLAAESFFLPTICRAVLLHDGAHRFFRLDFARALRDSNGILPALWRRDSVNYVFRFHPLYRCIS